MKLIRYEHPTFNHFDHILSQGFPALGRLSSVWDEVFGNLPNTHLPQADFYEDANHYTIRVELPGVKRDALSLDLEKSVLTLSVEEKSKDKDAHAQHRTSRSFSVPEDVQSDAVSAKLEDGILTITLPKSEHAQARQISVN